MSLRQRLTRHGRYLSAAAAGVGLLACLPEYQPKQAGDDDFVVKADSPEAVGESVEWIYVTSESAPPEMQCGVVLEALKRENSCKGPLCSHAITLGKDWIKGCLKYTPDGAPTVRAMVTKLEDQPSVGIRPCDQQGERLLENGCKSGSTCKAEVQTWATKCSGEISSPLVVSMVQIGTAQKLGKSKLEVDSRSCDDLAKPVREGADCALGTPCAKPLEDVELLRRRCTDQGIGVPIRDAIAMQSITAGAGQFGNAVPFTGPVKPITDREAQLPLSDGSGAILLVCERRTVDVEQYLDVRKSCNEGEILLAILDAGPKPPVIRMAKLDYFGDEDLLSRAPSLQVDGETALRERKIETAFKAELADVAKAGKGDVKAGLVKLVEVLTKYRRVIRNTDTGSAALQARDESLVPLFTELGKLKSKKATNKLSGNRFVTYVRRSTVLALSDVTSEGEVEIRAVNPAASFDLREHLPKAMAAYVDAMDKKIKRADKKKFPDSVVAVFVAKASEHAVTCANSESALLKSENMEMACAAKMKNCDEKLILDDSARAKAQTAAEAAYTKIWMNLATVSPARRTQSLGGATEIGCRAPWW